MISGSGVVRGTVQKADILETLSYYNIKNELFCIAADNANINET